MSQWIAMFTCLTLMLLPSMAFVSAAYETIIHDRMTMPNMTMLTSQYFTGQGSERVEVTYGPYVAASSSVKNGMTTYHEVNATKPCSDCLIIWMQAGLTYPNGTYANANTGLWLHHTVLTNMNRTDQVCGAGSPVGQPFFASGNERSIVDICVNGTDKAGYYFSADESLAFQVELMNENMDPTPVIVTITYEYLPGIPTGFSTVTPIWLDIGNCSSSEVAVPADPVFEYTMTPWKVPFSGRITEIVSHLHDGGINLEVTKNNETVCDCKSAYGQSVGYNDTSMTSMDGMNMSMNDMTHISSITDCTNVGSTEIGDEWSLKAQYNMTEHTPMLDSDGTTAPIMGIALVYVVNKDTAANDTPTIVSLAAVTSTQTQNVAAAAATMIPGLLIAGGCAAMLI